MIPPALLSRKCSHSMNSVGTSRLSPSAQKIEARIEKNASKLETKQTAAAITANTASAVADKTHDRCSEGKCN